MTHQAVCHQFTEKVHNLGFGIGLNNGFVSILGTLNIEDRDQWLNEEDSKISRPSSFSPACLFYIGIAKVFFLFRAFKGMKIRNM